MDAQPAPTSVDAQGAQPACDFVQREELTRELVAMVDDEIRALKMRIGVLEARRKRILRQQSS